MKTNEEDCIMIQSDRTTKIKELCDISYLQPDEQAERLRAIDDIDTYPCVGIEEWLDVNIESPIDETLRYARKIKKAYYIDSLPMTPYELSMIKNFLFSIADHNHALGYAQNHCFYNSQMIVLQAKYLSKSMPWLCDMEYCEGYVSKPNNLYPYTHGWCMWRGKIIDTTLLAPEFNHDKRRSDLSDRIFGSIPNGWRYFGVSFTQDEVQKYVSENDCWYAPFLNYNKSNFNLLDIFKKDSK
jgi:hypothetical protein